MERDLRMRDGYGEQGGRLKLVCSARYDTHRFTGQSFRSHRHDFLELLMVERTGGVHRVNGVDYPLVRGAVHCIGPGHEHAGMRRHGRSPCYRNLSFDPELLFSASLDEAERRVFMKLFYLADRYAPVAVDDTSFKNLLALYRVLDTERVRWSPTCDRLARGALMAMFAVLSRHVTLVPQPYDEVVCRVLAFMGSQFNRKIGMDDLTRLAGLSPARLCQVFKANTGRTLTESLMGFRITEARRLLAGTSMAIREVAEAAGFQDLSHFHRGFKRSMGVSPRAYRAKLEPLFDK